MVLEQGGTLRDGDQSDAQLGSMLVQGFLSLHTDGIGALIQHPECGLPEKEAGQADALLLACQQIKRMLLLLMHSRTLGFLMELLRWLQSRQMLHSLHAFGSSGLRGPQRALLGMA